MLLEKTSWKRITMLLYLFLLVIGVAVLLLWSLKPYWNKWKVSEPFEDVAMDQSQMNLLGNAYMSLTPNLQTRVNQTEMVTADVVQQTYESDVAAAQQSTQALQSSVEAEMNRFQMVPIQPMEQTMENAQAIPLTPEAQQMASVATEEARYRDYQQLVEMRDNNRLEHCYQRSCASTEKEMNAECEKFNETCRIQYGDNIHRCMKNLNQNCNRSLLDRCRDTCRRVLERRMARSKLTGEETLQMNERLTSPSGSTTLHLTDDGNLELWFNTNLLWKFNTNPSQNSYAISQGPYQMMLYPNGDLAIKNGAGFDIWHTNTWLDVFKGGTQNAPYEFVVGEREVFLKNKNGDILWKK
jgi:hypothetical protein